MLFVLYLATTVVAFLLATEIRNWLSIWHGEVFQPLLADTERSIYLIMAIWSVSLGLFGVHHKQGLRMPPALFKAIAFSAAMLLAAMFLLRYQHVSRTFLLIFLVLDTLLLSLLHLFWEWNERKSYRRDPHRMLVVGTDERAQALVRKLLLDAAGIVVTGYLTTSRHGAAEAAIDGIPVKGNLLELSSLLGDEIVDEVLFILPPEHLPAHEVAFAHCEEHGVPYRIVFEPLPKTHGSVRVEELNGIPTLQFSRVPIDGARLYFKRFVDVSVAALSLIVISPILLVIGALIKLTSRGPVIYSQIRLGKNGRRFEMFKFRTMIRDADAQKAALSDQNEREEPFFKIRRDPRVTKIGRLLRKWSLDELPQLLNVVRGDMSLVGPRPILPEELDFFRPWQRRRLSVTPGVTGLCQLKGRAAANFQERIDWDLRYIDNWSLSLDLKILLWTIPYVLLGLDAH